MFTELTIDTLVLAHVIHTRITLKLSQVVEMLSGAGNHALRPISHQISEKKQRLEKGRVRGRSGKARVEW